MNDGDHVLAVEIRTENGPGRLLRIPHIGPIEAPSGGVDGQSIRQFRPSLRMVFKSEPSGYADKIRPPPRSRKNKRSDRVAAGACALCVADKLTSPRFE